MPLPVEVAHQVDQYARADLPGDLSWHVDQFRFLQDDAALQQRVAEEFYTARYLYKVLEGLRPEDTWMQAAQVKLQILQYASIYEACLHHLLFDVLKNEPQVQTLLTYKTLIRFSVAPGLVTAAKHDDKQIVTAYRGTKKTQPSKVRFEDKVTASVALGVLAAELGEELKAVYSARNAIHLHAELKKHQSWDFELGRLAYWRMQPFCQALNEFVDSRAD